VAVDAGCVTTTLSTSSCQADTIVCTTDSECPATWTCVAQPTAVYNGIACAEPALLVDGSAVVLPCDVDGGAAPPSQSLCVPPYSTSVIGTGAGSGTTLNGSGNVPVASAPANGGSGTGSSGGGGQPAPTTGTAGSSSTNGGAATAATSPPAASGASHDETSDGGCQVGASPANTAPGALLGLLALLGFALRRRTRDSV
jgi:MYXO-CTERM domain-containing protein